MKFSVKHQRKALRPDWWALHDALMGHEGGALYTLYAGTEGPAFELMRATIEKVEYKGLKL